MKGSKYNFQTKDFNFPSTAYIACVSVKSSSGRKSYVFLTRVFENIEILRKYVLFVMDDFFKESEGMLPSYDGYFVEIKQDRLFKLSKKHWRNGEDLNSYAFRSFRNDVNIIKYWQMSEILVTPDGEIDGVEFYSFCVSLFKGSSDKHIDVFIQNSSHIVDIRAKYASFYSLNRPVKINWLGSGGKDVIPMKGMAQTYIN